MENRKSIETMLDNLSDKMKLFDDLFWYMDKELHIISAYDYKVLEQIQRSLHTVYRYEQGKLLERIER